MIAEKQMKQLLSRMSYGVPDKVWVVGTRYNGDFMTIHMGLGGRLLTQWTVNQPGRYMKADTSAYQLTRYIEAHGFEPDVEAIKTATEAVFW